VAGHLFAPFITTKPDGMGLGLVISRSLIRARGGDLLHELHGALGGATFTLRIPSIEQ
jgi:C4-dicarboxylate-specific signal transduction histidine kinase